MFIFSAIFKITFYFSIISSVSYVALKISNAECNEHEHFDYGQEKPQMDYTNNWSLRHRNKEVFDLSNDSEILFLISDISSHIFPDMPFGYLTTGCVVVPRVDRIYFRNIFLETYHWNDYKKCTLKEFLSLERRFAFDINGKVRSRFPKIYYNLFKLLILRKVNERKLGKFAKSSDGRNYVR